MLIDLEKLRRDIAAAGDAPRVGVTPTWLAGVLAELEEGRRLKMAGYGARTIAAATAGLRA